MRLLHTADWHLGRQLEGHPLEDDHAEVLVQVLAAAKTHDVDALIVAGDVFDRAAPPESSVRLLNEFMRRLVSETRAAVVLIAGNHDSAERIGAMALLADRRRALVRGAIAAEEPALLVADAHGPVAISALPFVYQHAARACFPEFDITSPADVLQAQLAAAKNAVPAGARWVVVAHAFVAGASASGSERSLDRVVGGIETVPAAMFDGAHYVALGHLHRPQAIGSDRIRYAGSPLALGFDEGDCTRSMALVDLAADGSVNTQLLPFRPLRRVRTLRGRLAELTAPGTERCEDFVRVVLTDPDRLVDPMRRLREIYPNACSLSYEERPGTRFDSDTRPPEAPPADPSALIARFLVETRGSPPTAAEATLVARHLAAIEDVGAAAA